MTSDLRLASPGPEEPTPSTSSAHYLGLDGLRGIAAAAVMLLHVVGFYAPRHLSGNSAAMAVDLFFMLSGFVLAHAYGGRLDQGMPWSSYFKIRLVRLYPMIVIGVSFGAAIVVGKLLLRGVLPEPGTGPIDFVFSLVLIPIGLVYPAWHYYLGGPQPFLLDRPMWSLFFEFGRARPSASR